MMFRNSKNFIQGNAMEGYDDLADVTVSNDNELQDDVLLIYSKIISTNFLFLFE
jgi:hypothetical protein